MSWELSRCELKFDGMWTRLREFFHESSSSASFDRCIFSTSVVSMNIKCLNLTNANIDLP